MHNYKQLFAILKDLNIQGARITKEDVVAEFTNGRTERASEMSAQEWRNMIQGLNTRTRGYIPPGQRPAKKDPLDNKRKRLLSTMYELAGANPEAWGFLIVKGKVSPDEVMKLINRIGCVKKALLNSFNRVELSYLIAQFDTILKREYAASGKHKDKA